MKILHVTDNYTPQGGVEQYILSVCRLLKKHGHENVVFFTELSPLTIQDDNWPAYHIKLDLDVAAQLESALNIEQPDVAYIHHVSSPDIITSLTAQLPTIAYVHGFSAVCPGLAKFYRRGDVVCERASGLVCMPMHYLRRCSSARNPQTIARLIRAADAFKKALLEASTFFVGSDYMAELLVQNGFPSSKIAILPPHFLPDDINLTYTAPAEPQSILFLGRLEIEKGFPYLLQALRQLPDTVQLLVAGEGTQRKSYEKLLEKFGLEERIKFLGWLDQVNLSQLLNRCALVVMPSIFPEPFGKSGIDALTHGRPVVAFDVGGISDWLWDDVTGLLARPSDSSDLASKIQTLLSDGQRREVMGRSGQNLVVKQYSADHHLAVLESAFQEACIV